MPAKKRVRAPLPPDLQMRAREAPCLFVTFDVETGKLVQIAAADDLAKARADVRVTALLHLIQQLRVESG